MSAAADENAPLPPLRQDLAILPTSPAPDGSRRYLIHDAVRGQFHRISEPVMRALALWQPLPADALSARLSHIPGFETDGAKTLGGFLLRNKLLILSGDTALADQEAARRRPWHEEIIHRYLYIRIPLFRPQALLDRIMPWIEPWLSLRTATAIAMMGFIGALLAARQWESFASTFLHFFTPQGALLYGLSLIIIKALHEMGHAIAARRYGADVPIIGVAFLVMFPILYTDTTDAWRLRSDRQRAVIDAAGMMMEVTIACTALLLWSVLPDGPARSIAFFAATTSWAMSLFVNLNPCMRFDGYYLLSDLLNIQNLQARGFAMGRWFMRRTLLGVDEGQPDEARPKLLLTYAYFTWIYRFFLFVGIALLVHHIFPKAVGIVLFVVEIGMFIALPISRELKHWWSLRMSILSNARGRITIAIALGLLVLACVPWQGRVIAPALIRPAGQAQIYAPEAAQITDILVLDGEAVRGGAPLVRLRSDAIEQARQEAQLTLNLAEAQLARQAADARSRADRSVLIRRVIEARAALAAEEARAEALILRAPLSGHVRDLPDWLRAGVLVDASTPLLSIHGQGAELIALPREADMDRLSIGANMTFISDSPETEKMSFLLQAISPTAQDRIEERFLSLPEGGPIAAIENDDGELIPEIPVGRVRSVRADQPAPRTQRGVVVIPAQRQSPARAAYRHVAGVLLRETDF